jgi:hypothetical protein
LPVRDGCGNDAKAFYLRLITNHIMISVVVKKFGTPYGIFEVIAALKVSSSLSVQG